MLQSLQRRGVKVLDGVVLESWKFDSKRSTISNAVFRYMEEDEGTKMSKTKDEREANATTTTTNRPKAYGATEKFKELLMLFSFAVTGTDYDMFQV